MREQVENIQNTSSSTTKNGSKENTADTLELRQQLAQSKEDEEKCRREIQSLEDKLEQTQEDQKLLSAQYARNAEELYDKTAKLEEENKKKSQIILDMQKEQNKNSDALKKSLEESERKNKEFENLLKYENL